jgi:predicted enzyme related to lactoylglutathione lyase
LPPSGDRSNAVMVTVIVHSSRLKKPSVRLYDDLRQLGGAAMRPSLPPAACAALAALVAAAPASAATPLLPAVADPPSQERHAGKIVFEELVTPDLAQAERFYGGLFGWTFQESDAAGGRYAEALLDGRPVAGILQRTPASGAQKQPWWLSYLSVPDVDAASKAAVANGAKTLFEPHSFPDRGREAVLRDPQGAVFALLASSSGDPPDELAQPGEWIWSTLIARDPDADAAFYQTVFGYEVFALAAEPGVRHLTLASDGYARATVNSPPPSRPDVRPHWLDFVRVADVPASTEKAVSLGAKVLVAPRPDRHGGRISVVADPAGAPFGLMEWADEGDAPDAK